MTMDINLVRLVQETGLALMSLNEILEGRLDTGISSQERLAIRALHAEWQKTYGLSQLVGVWDMGRARTAPPTALRHGL